MRRDAGACGAYRLVAITMLLLFPACARDTISRDDWQRMPETDRLLYVQSLVGAEKAKEAKGGKGRASNRPAEEIVMLIEQAYARGDARPAHQIFEELLR